MHYGHENEKADAQTSTREKVFFAHGYKTIVKDDEEEVVKIRKYMA